MSKSDKDLESRTVANSPLQQSSFVFFPEEETIRKTILEDPTRSIEAAKAALEGQREKLNLRRSYLRDIYARAAQAASALSGLAATFAQKLPQSVFGVGNGEDFIIPLDFLFEQIKEQENELDLLLLDLDPFWQPDPFDPARFAFLDSVLPQANLAKEAAETGARGEAILSGARAFSERIGLFCRDVIEPFFVKAEQAADVEHDGAGMRFGKLGALCGELQSAADRFAKECKETSGNQL